jgi:hypothetical protein
MDTLSPPLPPRKADRATGPTRGDIPSPPSTGMLSLFDKYVPIEAPSPLRIVESQLSILTFAGHNMLVLLDSAQQVHMEINGLATSEDDEIKPIGYLPSDRLKCYFFGGAHLYKPDQVQTCLIEGSREELKNRIDAAVEAGNQINAHNLNYPIFGFGPNSNSMASTLIRVMGLQEPERLPGGASIMPGAGEMLLDGATIAAIQSQFQIEPVRDISAIH